MKCKYRVLLVYRTEEIVEVDNIESKTSDEIIDEAIRIGVNQSDLKINEEVRKYGGVHLGYGVSKKEIEAIE